MIAIEAYLMEKIEQVDAWLIRLSQKRYWVLRLALILTGISFIFSPPKFEYFNGSFPFAPPAWAAVDYQTEHFLEPMPFSESSHMSKRVFRLTVPAFAMLTGIKGGKYWTILQMFLSGLFFYLLLRLTLNITGFSLNTLYFNIGLVGLFFAGACISDTGGRYDGYSYLFLLLAMYFRHPILLFIFTLLASFCDERAFMGCSLVFLWWLYQYLNSPKSTKTLLPLLAIPLAMFTYLGGRFWIEHQYQLSVQIKDVWSFEPLAHNIHYIPFAFLGAFEFYWLFIAIGVYFLYQNKQYLVLIGLLGGLAAMIITSFVVYDITSSLSFIFPALLLSFLVIYQNTQFEGFRKYFPLIGAASIAFPTYWVAIQLWYYLPLPLIMLQYLFAQLV